MKVLVPEGRLLPRLHKVSPFLTFFKNENFLIFEKASKMSPTSEAFSLRSVIFAKIAKLLKRFRLGAPIFSKINF